MSGDAVEVDAMFVDDDVDAVFCRMSLVVGACAVDVDAGRGVIS